MGYCLNTLYQEISLGYGSQVLLFFAYNFYDHCLDVFIPFSANQLKLTQTKINVSIRTKMIGSRGMTLLNLHHERGKKL